MAVIVDTSVLISIERDSLSRDNPALKHALPPDAAISVVTLMELRIGVLLADTPERRAARESFLAHVSEHFSVLTFSEPEAMAAAETLVHLRRAGLRIGERDLFIAATAIAGGHSIVTLNRAEFERVPGLVLAEPPTR